ncbi:MAG: heme biosynthesis protein HemY, partial [Pseudomonadota bacterium]
NFPAARRALGDMAEVDPDARALTIMAAVERGEGAADSVVKGWLAKAVTAPRGPQWVCDKCQLVQPEWVPVCESCDAFDALSWKEAPATEIATSTGLEMLPLIVGAIEDQSEETNADTVTEAEILDEQPVEEEVK